MKTSSNRSFLAFVLMLVASGSASIAVAAGPEPSMLKPTVKLHFDALDASSSAGARLLYDRIKDAARTVCRDGADWYPTVHWAHQECLQATVDHAVAELHVPAITAMHLAEKRSAKLAPPLQASNR